MRRAPVVIFGVLVAATFAAFFVAQRLKNAPSVVQRLMVNYTFSPNGDGRYDASHITFRIKQADDVTVEILDADGDPVRTLMDDKHLGAYKPIDAVMAAQRDLVEPLARFEPRLVKMAPSGEPPED